MDFICNVKSNGLVLRTELVDIPISNKSVTGTVLTENYITLNNNGTSKSDHAVIILTDAAKNLL
jgi:hypothetical protein